MPNYAIEVIAPGPIGPEGPPNVLTVGVVTLGAPTDPLIFQIVGDSPNQVVNVQIPRGFQGIQGIQGIQGNTGNTGPANTLDVISVTPLGAGATPTVVVSGAAPNQHLAFGIPAGAQGIQGLKGDKGDPGAGSVNSVNGDLGPAVVLTQDSVADGATYGRITKTERTRLAGVETGAEVTSNAKVVAAGAYVSGGTDVSVADGGTGRSTATTAYGIIAAGTTATGAQQTIAPGTSGQILKSNGTAALATFQTGVPGDVGLSRVNNRTTWVCDASVTLATLVGMGMITGDLIARRP